MQSLPPALRSRAEAVCGALMDLGIPAALDAADSLIGALDAIDAPWEDMEPEGDCCEAHDDDPSWWMWGVA